MWLKASVAIGSWGWVRGADSLSRLMAETSGLNAVLASVPGSRSEGREHDVGRNEGR